MMGMVSQDRRMLLDYLWDREDPDDPESMEWRDDLDAEELALVESWDRIYAQATLKICEDMLALSEGGAQVSDSVFRSGRKQSFTVLYNSMLRDHRLSLKAKGLLPS